MSARSSPVPSSSTLPSTSSDKGIWTPQGRNPVSLRIYKVLGTNFDDEATREALETLSDLYAAPPTSASKGKQARREQEDDPAEDDSHQLPSGVVAAEAVLEDSAARARKHLRRDMENKLAEGSRQFLAVFGEVDQKLDELQTHVAAMHESCDQAEAQLKLTSEASKSLLERAGSLRDERQQVEAKKSIIALFLARFTLDEKESDAITSRDVPVGQRFFQAMDKTERIRNDCRVLMGGEEGPTQAGLDIMAATSAHLEQGYEKIFRWCVNEFRQMGRDTQQLEVNRNMREAIRRLRSRPELLNDALTSLSQTRQATLLTIFLTALTRGGPSGLPRPIELHAHDPMRYVGDMLAWVHQTIAAEREFLESLFELEGDGRMVGSVRVFHKDKLTEEEEWIKELMDLAVGKLCVPLKVRVQQTVRSQESSIISYKIANLLQFYLVTMSRTIGEDALLSTTLKEITDVAYQVFYDAIEAQGRTLLRFALDLNDTSVTPPSAILEHAHILREIMTTTSLSFLSEDEQRASVDDGLRRILDIMVDPAIEMCLTSGEGKKALRPSWDYTIFALNCLTFLQGVLEPYAFTAEKQAKVQELVDSRVSSLVEEHFADVMNDAGLTTISAACTTQRPGEPLSHLPAAQPTELRSALRNFSLWLSGPEVVQSPRLAQLTAPNLHSDIHRRALERLADRYQALCDAVRKPENKYEAAATLLGSERPFGQVHLLWQIFGLEREGSSTVV